MGRRYYARLLSSRTDYRVPAPRCSSATPPRSQAWSVGSEGPAPGTASAIHLFLSLHYVARSPAALAQLGWQFHRYLCTKPGPSGIRPYVPREDAVHRPREIKDHCTIARHVGPDKLQSH
jgi:hypothetical protein